jgi:outer membrane protein OmpA-like peptidoglycan-associated protein
MRNVPAGIFLLVLPLFAGAPLSFTSHLRSINSQSGYMWFRTQTGLMSHRLASSSEKNLSLTPSDAISGFMHAVSENTFLRMEIPLHVDNVQSDISSERYFGMGDMNFQADFVPSGSRILSSPAFHLGVFLPTGSGAHAVYPRYFTGNIPAYSAQTLRICPGISSRVYPFAELPLEMTLSLQGDIAVEGTDYMRLGTGLLFPHDRYPLSLFTDLDISIQSDVFSNGYYWGSAPASLSMGVFYLQGNNVIESAVSFGLNRDRYMEYSNPLMAEYGIDSVRVVPDLSVKISYIFGLGSRSESDSALLSHAEPDSGDIRGFISVDTVDVSLIAQESTFPVSEDDDGPILIDTVSLKLEDIYDEPVADDDVCRNSNEKMEEIATLIFNNTPYLSGNEAGYATPAICKELLQDTLDPVVLYGIRFNMGSAEILPNTLFRLDALERILHTHSQVRAVITGYTDASGSFERNKELSRKRAQSVKQELVHRGIDAGRFSVVGRGPLDPVADNRCRLGQNINRRIEVTFYAE